MKRFLMFSFIALIVLASTSADALRIHRPSIVPPPNGETQQGVLYLFQKTDPAGDGPWQVVHGGAWGVLRYNLWGKTFGFVFHGRNLAPGEDYTLIYYPDPWPGTGLICLGSAKANPAGNLAMFNHHFDIGTNLPAEYDANWKPIFPSGAVGAKIWLVLSSDVDCTDEETPVGEVDDGIPNTSMTGWNPDNYLFEYNLINFELLGH
jgi:hypothetical protein